MNTTNTPATIADMNPDAHYTVDGYKGIAFYYDGPETEPDEDTEWSGYEVETGRVRMVMVGDDRVHIADLDECHEIPEESFCHDCGQIGCDHTA
jgi:hypothetical protein